MRCILLEKIIQNNECLRLPTNNTMSQEKPPWCLGSMQIHVDNVCGLWYSGLWRDLVKSGRSTIDSCTFHRLRWRTLGSVVGWWASVNMCFGWKSHHALCLDMAARGCVLCSSLFVVKRKPVYELPVDITKLMHSRTFCFHTCYVYWSLFGLAGKISVLPVRQSLTILCTPRHNGRLRE